MSMRKSSDTCLSEIGMFWYYWNFIDVPLTCQTANSITPSSAPLPYPATQTPNKALLYRFRCIVPLDFSFLFNRQPFYQTNANTRLGEENKGALLMKKMGWGGQGLGAREQGIVDPVSGGEVRDKMDMYRGVGVEINDPFESFRKNKSSSFMTRMKSRAAKSAK